MANRNVLPDNIPRDGLLDEKWPYTASSRDVLGFTFPSDLKGDIGDMT